MTCKNCGAELKENRKFCAKCGMALDINYKLSEGENKDLAKSTLKLQKKFKNLSIIFGILLFISFVLLSFSCWQYVNAKQVQKTRYNQTNLQAVKETTEPIVSSLEQFKKTGCTL